MTEREALADLLEAVDLAIYSGDWRVDGACDPDAAIQRARNVLAQPEQEPAAWMNDMGTHIDLNVSGRGTPLYTTPPQRKPLTDEEKQAMWTRTKVYLTPKRSYFQGIADSEAAHQIKENP